MYNSQLISLITTDLLRVPYALEIILMIPNGVLSPFMYLLDIVKDLTQLVLIITAVHGVQNVFEYWSSFSSVVSTETKQIIL